MRSRFALSLLGACWFGACSFPDYDQVPVPDPFASVCTDGVPSDAESGIDCGGGCPPCGLAQMSRTFQDCESLACANGTCQMATCTDKVKNGAEADTDCGGQCDACAPGRDCRGAEDCAEGVCSDAFCQVPTCLDGVRNGDEAALDCGGSCDALCQNGDACSENADCMSQHCSELVCVAPGCTDGLPNNTETDVDCGGNECGPCEATEQCLNGSDCVGRICDQNQACTAYSCDDKVLNGDETEIDCGGGSCEGCGNLQNCDDGGDCTGGACQASLCVPAAPTGEVLAREGFSADASDSYPDDHPNEVLDSVGGRWTSGAHQYDGMWFEVDMGQLQAFFAVVLTCDEQPDDIPVKFDLYLSVDGEYGEPAQDGLFGKPITEVTFGSAQVARYVKFVLRQEANRWLSINEINIVQ